MYELTWMADSRRLHFRRWHMAVLLEARSTASRKLAAASVRWEQANVLWSTNILADEAPDRWYMSQVHTVTQAALWQTTLSDTRWEVQENTAWRMKRLRHENPNAKHKRRKTRELEVPKNLRDMKIPLGYMGDVIVLSRV